MLKKGGFWKEQDAVYPKRLEQYGNEMPWERHKGWLERRPHQGEIEGREEYWGAIWTIRAHQLAEKELFVNVMEEGKSADEAQKRASIEAARAQRAWNETNQIRQILKSHLLPEFAKILGRASEEAIAVAAGYGEGIFRNNVIAESFVLAMEVTARLAFVNGRYQSWVVMPHDWIHFTNPGDEKKPLAVIQYTTADIVQAVREIQQQRKKRGDKDSYKDMLYKIMHLASKNFGIYKIALGDTVSHVLQLAREIEDLEVPEIFRPWENRDKVVSRLREAAKRLEAGPDSVGLAKYLIYKVDKVLTEGR